MFSLNKEPSPSKMGHRLKNIDGTFFVREVSYADYKNET
jgi:hypothetical protein